MKMTLHTPPHQHRNSMSAISPLLINRFCQNPNTTQPQSKLVLVGLALAMILYTTPPHTSTWGCKSTTGKLFVVVVLPHTLNYQQIWGHIPNLTGPNLDTLWKINLLGHVYELASVLGDICPGNICPFNICPGFGKSQLILSRFWPKLDTYFFRP